jgi:MFS family permease
MFISLIGSWIQITAQSWLVFELTKSAFLLGLVSFLNLIPVFFLSLFGGVLADRINKRNILIITQNAFMILAFILGYMTQAEIITPKLIMIIALLNGIVMAFDAPSRQAMVVELVGKSHLMNAVALNSLAFNSSRIIGPALAAILVAGIGMYGCFYINGFSFIAVIAALMMIKNGKPDKINTGNSLLKDIKEALYYIKDNRIMLILVAIVGVISLFGVSYVILMPVFARNVLGSGVKEFGKLMSAIGAGAILSTLLLAKLGDFKNKGKFLLFSLVMFSVSLILLSFTRQHLLAIAVLVFLGWGAVSATAIINTLLQDMVSDRLRGRVMSIFMFTFAGMMPFGNLVTGYLASVWDVSNAILFSGIICLVFSVYAGIFFPKLRSL